MDYAIEIFTGSDFEHSGVFGVYPIKDKVTFNHFVHLLDSNLSFSLIVQSITTDYFNVRVDRTCLYYTVVTTTYIDEYTVIKILITDMGKITAIDREQYDIYDGGEEMKFKLSQWYNRLD